MNTLALYAPLAARDHLVGIAPFLIGLFLVGVLLGAVIYGISLRRRGEYRRSVPSGPRPSHATGREEGRHTTPDEMPRDGRRRLPPYEVHDHGVTETDEEPDEEHRRWGGKDSGSFGSGGIGHTG